MGRREAVKRPCLTFRPRLTNAEHRRAWELLQSVPERHKGDYLVQAILHRSEEESLEKMLRRVIREELKRPELPAALSQQVESAVPVVPNQMLDFLASL